METQKVDVLICGAGASGLTLGIELARRGVSFQIIEKLSEPFYGSKGKGLQPRSLEIMEDLGVVDKVFSHGLTNFNLRRYSEDGKSFEDLPAQESYSKDSSEPYGSSVLIPQYFTEAIFRERLVELGFNVHFGSELLGFEEKGEAVFCEVRTPKGEQAIEAKFLVGCDGGKSFVRKSLGLKFEGDFLDAPPFLSGDVEVEGISRDIWHRWHSRDREKFFALAPLPRGQLIQIQCPLPAQDDKYLTKEEMTKIARERTSNDAITITRVSWASIFRFSSRLAEHYRKGRVFICGDAAHVHPPTGGQGLNTSLQDAYNLGWKLALVLEGAPMSLLDSYEEERRPIALGMLELSTHIMKTSKLQRGRETQQLDLAYDESPLSFKGSIEKRTIAAGNRAPDARLRGAGGQHRRLFELMIGTHFTLVINGDFPGSERFTRKGLRVIRIGEEGELWDEDLEFQKYYGLNKNEAVLIRPDGYIAGLISSEDLSSFEEYLKRLGLRR